jgi:hypothetical protein
METKVASVASLGNADSVQRINFEMGRLRTEWGVTAHIKNLSGKARNLGEMLQCKKYFIWE